MTIYKIVFSGSDYYLTNDSDFYGPYHSLIEAEHGLKLNKLATTKPTHFDFIKNVYI